MARLAIMVDTHHDMDPALTDPEQVAEDIIYDHNESCRVNGTTNEAVKMLSAEWVD